MTPRPQHPCFLRRSSHDKMAKAMAGGRREPRVRHTSWNAPNAELGNLYIFGDDVDEQELLEEDAIELAEVRPRGERRRDDRGRKDEGDTVLLERTIMPGDTLQTFALLYGCTLADLSRANNLMSDQDFHALKTIKVPVKRHGLLTAREEEDRRRRQYRRADSDSTEYNFEAGGSPNSRDAYAEMNDIRGYLNQMDEEMDRIRRSTPEREETFEPYETRASLMECRRYISRETSNGADGGIRWWMALLCMLIVAVVCPLVYFLYFHSKNDEHSTKKP